MWPSRPSGPQDPSAPAAGAILVTGASGLIGSHVLAAARAASIPVRAISRRPPRGPSQDGVEWVTADFGESGSTDWLRHLRGVRAVVNCAGLLQGSPGESLNVVHVTGPAALFEACELAGVSRVVHLSAIGVDRGGLSAFSQTKLAGDRLLASSSLDWVILRPSVVVGRSAFGGSALFRGLAAAPLSLRPPSAGPVQVVQLDDLVTTILQMIEPGAPSRLVLEIVGPDRLDFEEIVAAYRAWLGWRPAPAAVVPGWLMGAAYRLGDLAGWLGWRSPVRSTARREMTRGAVGDPSAWIAASRFQPQSLAAALSGEPASVQERWFAKLYLLKSIVFVVFSGFWIATAFVSLGPGYRIGVELMRQAGAGPFSGPAVVAGALADLLIGLGVAYRPTARMALRTALALSLFYVVAGSFLTPWLWAEPLGPLLKIWPILTLNLVALAILDER